MTHSPDKRQRLLVPIAFLCVYFFWGSTFVAIRYAVRFLTPPLVSGLRSVAAGGLLLLILRCTGRSIAVPRKAWPRLLLLSWLLVTGNNLLLGVGEMYVTAGYAALLTASIPMLIAVMESMLPDGKPLSWVGWGGTALGVCGLALLLEPALRAGLSAAPGSQGHAVALGTGVLLFGISCWVTGSLISTRTQLHMSPFLISAMQMLIGGTTNAVIGSAIGGWHTAHWTPGLFGAITWLALFGSMVGFSAYTYLLHHVPVARVATYAYVNPAVAVVLSAIFLHESLHGTQWIAMAVILIAVAIITASKSRPLPAADPAEQVVE